MNGKCPTIKVRATLKGDLFNDLRIFGFSRLASDHIRYKHHQKRSRRFENNLSLPNFGTEQKSRDYKNDL